MTQNVVSNLLRVQEIIIPVTCLSSNVAFAGQVHFQTHPFDIKKYVLITRRRNNLFCLNQSK